MIKAPTNYRALAGCLGTTLVLAAGIGWSAESNLRSEEPVYRCPAAEVLSSTRDAGKPERKVAATPAADAQPPATVQNLRRVDRS